MCLIWILFMLLGCAATRDITDRSTRKWIHTQVVPWVGVLSYKEKKDATEAIAGITLISTKLAIGNAHEVAIIDKRNVRSTTNAMFLSKTGDVQYCEVAEYILHPEYDEDTLNTIALLKLECDEKQLQWKMVEWPKDFSQMNEHQGDIFMLGYTDRLKALEQVMHRMEYVNLSECQHFYKHEELDSKWMAPVEYQCFRKKYSSQQCVIDSGMALAAHSEGKWTLIGMSILGPGCSLPARFVDFARYVPWIEVITKATRRFVPEYKIHWPNYDKVIMQKLNDSSLAMRPYNGTEVIYGKCDKIDGVEIFREETKFKLPYHVNGLYALSLWDKFHPTPTCVMLTVTCLQRSINPFNFDFGLVQYDEDLEGLVKSIPITQVYRTVRPKVVHLKNGMWITWWNLKRDDSKISSVIFRFEFEDKANIKLIFYGQKPIDEDSVPKQTTTTILPSKRSRRPHPHHIRPVNG